MSYLETVKYLGSFINYERIPAYPYKESLKLERIKGFLDIIGNPQGSLKCLHVAGTKGKGSTCAFIAHISRESGYKAGLYTSPHLSDFRERIRILSPGPKAGDQNPDFEGMIPECEVTSLISRLKPAIEKYNKNSKYGPLSFFEVYTSLAFVYFKEQKVDFAVLETGLGGRLDATNVVNPYACVITSLSYEHTQKLGGTLRAIATEKAGIIKKQKAGARGPGPIVISAPQEPEAIEVIRNKCKETGAILYEVGKHIILQGTGTGFSVKGIFGEYPDLKINLLGSHQLINAAAAVGIIEALRLHNINVGADSIRRGLYNTVWPGRCEVVSQHPFLVLDGAQNAASAKTLKETIKDNFSSKGGAFFGKGYKRLILVLGISSDKDIKGICGELYDLADEVILTKSHNPRAQEPEALAGYFNGKDKHMTGSVKEAKALAGRIAGKEDLILVCGSLFVVGEFRNDKI
ncbi:MAG: folylpolyglutamate synthase/dihydrofolate synthase family protein [Candidatus Omnitrophota bacterium]